MVRLADFYIMCSLRLILLLLIIKWISSSRWQLLWVWLKSWFHYLSLTDSARWREIEEAHTFLFVYYFIDTDAVTQQVRIVELFFFEKVFFRRLWVRLRVNIYLRHFILPVLVTHVIFPPLGKVVEHHLGNGVFELPSLRLQCVVLRWKTLIWKA